MNILISGQDPNQGHCDPTSKCFFFVAVPEPQRLIDLALTYSIIQRHLHKVYEYYTSLYASDRVHSLPVSSAYANLVMHDLDLWREMSSIGMD